MTNAPQPHPLDHAIDPEFLARCGLEQRRLHSLWGDKDRPDFKVFRGHGCYVVMSNMPRKEVTIECETRRELLAALDMIGYRVYLPERAPDYVSADCDEWHYWRESEDSVARVVHVAMFDELEVARFPGWVPASQIGGLWGGRINL